MGLATLNNFKVFGAEELSLVIWSLALGGLGRRTVAWPV